MRDLNQRHKATLPVEPEKAILIGLITGGQTEEKLTEYFDELEFLASTAGAITVKRFTQKVPHPDVRSFVGSGKLEDIRWYVENHGINLVITDDDLSGTQINVLESVLKVKVLDRSMLILDIFATRAQSAQAKTQVELAQLQYLLPRLKGMWTHLERQRGGIGMRGPGEQEIETDRRVAKDTIARLKSRLQDFDKQALTQRKSRGELVRVSLVGYTNVGKSTIMNLLSKSDVFAENKLFATLDTTVRKVVFGQMPFLLSDTVGFIRKLPHHLVDSFKSTLDEVRESDILLHVVDISHAQYEDQIAVVRETLNDIGVTDKQVLFIFNKMDTYRDNYYDEWLTLEVREELETGLIEMLTEKANGKAVFMSATRREGVDTLRETITDMVSECYRLRYPHVDKFW